MFSAVVVFVSCVCLTSAQFSPTSRNDVNRGRTDRRSNLQSTLRQNDRLRHSELLTTPSTILRQSDTLRQADSLNTLSTNLPVNGIDLVTYDTKTQPTCREIQRGPVGTRECGWNAGLSRNVDQFYLNGRIAAYKIQWQHGSWSEWYVPGVNDIDIKFNVQATYCPDYEVRANSMRRWWAYFNEYTHVVIICEDETKKSRKL